MITIDFIHNTSTKFGKISICTNYYYICAKTLLLIDVQLVWYQGIVKSTVSGVFQDLKLKISEGSDQNWCFPESAQLAVSAKLRQLSGQSQENTNFGLSLLKF